MHADPLLAALDEALECPEVAHLSRADRLALALWWLIERVADEFQMSPEQVACEAAMLCGLAKEMMRQTNSSCGRGRTSSQFRSARTPYPRLTETYTPGTREHLRSSSCDGVTAIGSCRQIHSPELEA